MNCDEILRRIDEEERPPEVVLHRLECPSCDARFREAERIDDLVRGLRPPEPADAYWPRYHTRLHDRLIRPSRPRFLPWLAAAAAVLVGVLLLRPDRKETPVPPPAVALSTPPTPLTRFMTAFLRYASEEDAEKRKSLRKETMNVSSTEALTLARLVQSDDPKLPAAALSILEEIRPRSAIPLLQAALGAEPEQDRAILRCIVRIDASEGSRILADSLADRTLQPSAAAVCRELPGPRAVRIFLASYEHLCADCRASADEILLSRPDLSRTAFLQRMASTDDAAAAALAPLAGKLQIRSLAPEWIRISANPDHTSDAMSGLLALQPGVPLRALFDLPSGTIAEYVRRRGDRAIDELLRLAVDRDERVARKSVQLLSILPGDETQDALGRALLRPATHREAAEAFALRGGPEAIRRLRDVLPVSPNPETILAALAKIDSSPDSILTLVSSPRVPLDPLAEALANRPREQVVPALIALLDRMADRPRAHELLKRITGERLSPQSIAWKNWWNRREQG